MAIPLGAKIVGGILLFGLSVRFSKKKRNSTDDSKPATLTDRGVRLPVIVGRTRAGAIHAFEGDRVKRQEPFSGGAGGKGVGSSGGSQNDVFFASGWHLICVGPANRLIEIYENGEQILDKTAPNGFDPISLPSGSVIPLKQTEEGNSRGTARIYWGEANQPVDAFLSAPTRLGFSSNHKFVCHVVWQEKRLGGAGTWPSLEYEIEVRPYNPGQLVGVAYDTLPSQLGPLAIAGDPWLANSLGIPTGASCFDILDTDAGPPGSIKVAGNQLASFPVDGFLRIRNNSSGVNGDYQIQASTFNAAEVSPPQGGGSVPRPITNVPSVLNSWTFTGGAGVSDAFPMLGPTGGPPGVVIQGFGASVSQAPAFFLTGIGNVIGPLLGTSDPDPGSPGNAFQFNNGYNFLTFYVRATTALPAFSSDAEVGFNSPGVPEASRSHVVRLSSSLNQVSIVSTSPGVFAELVPLGTSSGPNNWYRVSVRFRVGDGGISVNTDTARLLYRSLGSAVGMVFVHGEGQAGTQRKWLYSPSLPIVGVTTIQTYQSLSGITDFNGQVCPVTVNENGYQGANGAHILNQLLFETAPHGLGLDAACFDQASLQSLGLLLDAPQEGIRSHVVVPDSTTLDAVVQALLEELMVNLSWDTTLGQWVFVPVRRKAVADGIVERDILVPDLPARRRRFGEDLRTKLVFLYNNVDLRYRQDAVLITEDGRATLELREDSQKITLRTVTDPEAAGQVGELRSRWEFSNPTGYSVQLNRDAAVLRPGDLLDFGDLLGTDLPLRVMSLQVSSESAVVEVFLATDPFAEENIPISSFRLGPAPGPQADTAALVQEDCIQRLWEASSFLGQRIQFVPLRVPLKTPAPKASLYASSDGINYRIEDEAGYVSGGRLALDYLRSFQVDESDSNAVINRYHIEDGPFIQACNEDFGQGVVSLPDAEWAAGRQMLIVGQEVMFVREFQPYGGTLWQARGVLRARLDTPLSDLLFDTPAFVVVGSPLNTQLSKILTAGRGLDTHWKLVPTGIAPGSILATIQNVSGTGIRPMRLSGFNTEEFSSAWVQGRDIVLRWNYRLPQGLVQRSGAGMQGYGEATGSGSPGEPWPGVFRVALLDSTGTISLVGPVDVPSASWTIPAATVAAALLAEGLPPNSNLLAAVIPIYSTGEIGDRVQILLSNAG